MNTFDRGRALAFSVAAGLAFAAGSASAATIDLTSAGSWDDDGKAIWTAEDLDPTAGTGVIQPFLTIANSPIEEGYNSGLSAQEFEFDEKRSPGFTREVLIGDLAVIDGYYQLFADWNEPNGGGQDTLSILTFEVWIDDDGKNDSFGTGSFSATELIYSLSHQINTVDFSGGSGQQDMSILLDVDLFEGADPNDYFMVYAVLGWNCETTRRGGTTCEGGFETSGGFEEFSAVLGEGTPPPPPPPVPLPAAGWMLLGGLGGLAALRRKKKVS